MSSASYTTPIPPRQSCGVCGNGKSSDLRNRQALPLAECYDAIVDGSMRQHRVTKCPVLWVFAARSQAARRVTFTGVRFGDLSPSSSCGNILSPRTGFTCWIYCNTCWLFYVLIPRASHGRFRSDNPMRHLRRTAPGRADRRSQGRRRTERSAGWSDCAKRSVLQGQSTVPTRR
jgi:hypothetical protein